METLRSRKFSSVLEHDPSFRFVTNHEVRADRGLLVQDFPELVEKVARLSFFNSEQILLFRGQNRDWLNRLGNSSLKPTMFRSQGGGNQPPCTSEMVRRYQVLAQAEKILWDEFYRSRLDEWKDYRPHEIDFGRRLLAKFRLHQSGFWSKEYSAIPLEALYPDERDPLVEMCHRIRSRLVRGERG